jgi:hypothetical protein
MRFGKCTKRRKASTRSTDRAFLHPIYSSRFQSIQVTDEYNPLISISHAASGIISITGRINAQLFDEQGICPIDMRLISYYTVYRVPRDNSCNKASRCRKYHLGRNLHVWCTWWIYIFWCDPCSIYSLGYRCTRSSVLINV